MSCYVCDRQGFASNAVAVCQDCGAALCREHLDESLLARRPGGLSRTSCSHALQAFAWLRRSEAEPLARIHRD